MVCQVLICQLLMSLDDPVFYLAEMWLDILLFAFPWRHVHDIRIADIDTPVCRMENPAFGRG